MHPNSPSLNDDSISDVNEGIDTRLLLEAVGTDIVLGRKRSLPRNCTVTGRTRGPDHVPRKKRKDVS